MGSGGGGRPRLCVSVPPMSGTGGRLVPSTEPIGFYTPRERCGTDGAVGHELWGRVLVRHCSNALSFGVWCSLFDRAFGILVPLGYPSNDKSAQPPFVTIS
eukprot:GHVO01011034.1.p2 GENE.GHVO01011034.1~~GHVO01011034.1.p2  ORF type:complete len:101 (-),score=9.08 GHVO01011034.1:104-406(-)